VKTFRVLELSRNHNSFGLRGVILVAQDGEAWEIGTSDVNCPQRGRSYGVIVPDSSHRDRTPHFGAFGWELPRRLPNAPPEIVAEAWKEYKHASSS
jgi:hypothetical protein